MLAASAVVHMSAAKTGTVRALHGKKALGVAAAFLDGSCNAETPCFGTLTMSNEHVPSHWFDAVNESNAGLRDSGACTQHDASLERGEKKKLLHIHFWAACKMENHKGSALKLHKSCESVLCATDHRPVKFQFKLEASLTARTGLERKVHPSKDCGQNLSMGHLRFFWVTFFSPDFEALVQNASHITCIHPLHPRHGSR